MRYSTRIQIGIMVVIFSIGVILGTNGLASAQSACSEDKAKLCKDNQANKADMLYCLESHENELSASCKKHIAKISDMREKAKEYPQSVKMTSQNSVRMYYRAKETSLSALRSMRMFSLPRAKNIL